MAYTALYRKFRPLKFSDMVGQDRITRTLKNQIMSGRVGHAYLFNGGRGTGKTTSAKILARAVNCLNPQDGEPCNECEICKEILDGSLTDVVEMDAASNNSVEDIRSIRDEVNFLPTKAKYRVYIIDEVHMLSVGAFNALLKTLEEPPAHVKFILATTEPQKLPTTILSRCQRFDFKKISEEDIIKRLRVICKDAEIEIDEDALKLISVLAEGAMRDAISILERCYQESSEKVTSQIVKELVGIPSLVTINKITSGIINNDEITSLDAIDDVLKDGKDLYNFLWEVIKYVKDILVFKATNKLELYSAEEIEEIKKLADKVTKERLLQIIYQLSELENNIKWSAQKTIMFQTGIIKLCAGENIINNGNQANDSAVSSGNTSALEARIANLENKLTNLQISPRTSNGKTVSSNVPSSSRTPSIAQEQKKVNEAPVNTSGKEAEVWSKVITNLKQTGKIRLYTTLVNTKINPVNDLTWEVIFVNGLTDFTRKILEDSANRNDLNKIIFMEIGKEINLKFVDGKANTSTNTKATNDFENDFGIDINVIE
jgi:DNA polymerase-3 subunit gamma/tau